jgi:hypothetical protein
MRQPARPDPGPASALDEITNLRLDECRETQDCDAVAVTRTASTGHLPCRPNAGQAINLVRPPLPIGRLAKHHIYRGNNDNAVRDPRHHASSAVKRLTLLVAGLPKAGQVDKSAGPQPPAAPNSQCH